MNAYILDEMILPLRYTIRFAIALAVLVVMTASPFVMWWQWGTALSLVALPGVILDMMVAAGLLIEQEERRNRRIRQEVNELGDSLARWSKANERLRFG